MAQLGTQSIQFEEAPYILSSASVVGAKEGEGPLGKKFDVVGQDDQFGEETWEAAESALQKEAAVLAMGKAGLKKEAIRYIFGGDLLGQSIATTFGLMELNVPLFGLFGACSTAGEALSLAAMTVAAGYADQVLAVTSSHFASAEKQFRFPLEYANQRPLSACWTVTGGGAFVVGRKGKAGAAAPSGGKTEAAAPSGGKTGAAAPSGGKTGAAAPSDGKTGARITGITTGRVMDYGVKDSMNMGAAMAPAACDTIYRNFLDFGRGPQDYDRIVTGDLGYVGREILIKLLQEKGFDITSAHMDCGIEIYDRKAQDTHAGGSGCGCSAVTLSAHILPQIIKGAYRRVLFVPTGALLSKVSFNEGQTVPGIAHGVVIEHG